MQLLLFGPFPLDPAQFDRWTQILLSISLTRAEASGPCWEEFAAVGMEDQELARLNLWNTFRPEAVRWEHMLHFIGGTRRS